MAYRNHLQVPFWDFVRSLDQNGAGIDHSSPGHPAGHPPPSPSGPGFPLAFDSWAEPGNFSGPGFGHFHGHGRGGFGGPGFKDRGHRGRHCRRERAHAHEHEHEHEPSRSRSRTASPGGEHSAPEAESREGGPTDYPHGPRRHGKHGRGGHRGPRGRGYHGHGGRRGPGPAFGGPGGMGGFDLRNLFSALNAHPVGQQPWARMLHQYAQQAGFGSDSSPRSGLENTDADNENTFTPPLDIFSTSSAYILHLALPGAKKEDVDVNWDVDAGSLHIAGVVYRPGDEDFLKTLRCGERKVGSFERAVKLPPAAGLDGEKEDGEVDAEGISAKLQDGILVVTVPKVEREWTEIKRVDIE
ncbi:hypothetical protein QTJ16_004382 [Diplocarpon rosae]|uniref:SHSP domain-containing protein n=1 Tax=Diplocarpon rosae TaxID=946125 RepID=A0AAD9T0P8_9HELO|nr:hypothetical protein QTJ16_004382 [Diplocarpon rosae]